VDAQQPSIPSLTDTNWTLWKFEERGGSVLEPEDRTKYTLRFGAQLEAQLDCNKLQSTWKATGAELQFGKLEGPRLKCAAGSMADRMVRDWTGIRSYSVRSSLLYLALKNGRGWYVFQPVVPIPTRPTASVTSQYGPIQFDSKGVEFGFWIRRFLAQLKKNWYALMPPNAMALRGSVVLAFDVYKDGRLTNIERVTPSVVDTFNEAAEKALALTDPTQSLPAEYPDEKVRFTITFYYNEKTPDTPATVSPQ
jgi:TonB family protein